MLVGAYHVSTPDALAYGIVLQAVEVATAVIMGLPALVNEGLSWREVRLRTMHAAPVTLGAAARRGARRDARRRRRAGALSQQRHAGRHPRAGARIERDADAWVYMLRCARRLALHGLEQRRRSGAWRATARASASRYTASRLPRRARARAADGRPPRGDARGGAHQAPRPRREARADRRRTAPPARSPPAGEDRVAAAVAA